VAMPLALTGSSGAIVNGYPVLCGGASNVTSKTGETRCQFHQHFTREFFGQKCFAQLFSLVTFGLCNC